MSADCRSMRCSCRSLSYITECHSYRSCLFLPLPSANAACCACVCVALAKLSCTLHEPRPSMSSFSSMLRQHAAAQAGTRRFLREDRRMHRKTKSLVILRSKKSVSLLPATLQMPRPQLHTGPPCCCHLSITNDPCPKFQPGMKLSPYLKTQAEMRKKLISSLVCSGLFRPILAAGAHENKPSWKRQPSCHDCVLKKRIVGRANMCKISFLWQHVAT